LHNKDRKMQFDDGMQPYSVVRYRIFCIPPSWLLQTFYHDAINYHDIWVTWTEYNIRIKFCSEKKWPDLIGHLKFWLVIDQRYFLWWNTSLLGGSGGMPPQGNFLNLNTLRLNLKSISTKFDARICIYLLIAFSTNSCAQSVFV